MKNAALRTRLGGVLLFFTVTVSEVVAQSSAPMVVESPASLSIAAGGVASFRVVANGTPSLRYQWFHDGLSIQGSTDSVLVIAPLTLTHAGNYFVTVTNVLGSVTSAPAQLTVQPASATPIVDLAFRGDPSLGGIPQVVGPLADGRVLLATSITIDVPVLADRTLAKLIRLRAEGRIDPDFQVGAATIDEFQPQSNSYPPQISQLIVQSDGRILVAGHFVAFNGVSSPCLVRLNPDGSVDNTFSPAANLVVADNRFSFVAIALQADGKIVASSSALGLVRLLPNGQRDPTFNSALPSTAAPRAITVGPEGRIYVNSGATPALTGTGVVSALLSDGRDDPTFTHYSSPTPILQLYPVPGGKLIVATQVFMPAPGPGRYLYTVARLLPNGTLDPSFAVRNFPLSAPPMLDGSVLINGKIVAPDGVTETSPNFGVGYQDFTPKAFGADGRLWITGPFSIYNGVTTSRIVHLNIVASENLTPPKILTAGVDQPLIKYGESFTLQVAAVGPGPLTYTWQSEFSVALPMTTEPTLTYTPTSPYIGGNYTVRVANSAGSVTSAPISVTILPGELRIAAQPRRVSLTAGKYAQINLTLAATAVPNSVEWKRDGVPVNYLPGSTAPDAVRQGDVRYLEIGNVRREHAGVYTATLRDQIGQTITTDPIIVTVDDVARFTNLSTRAQVGAGAQTAILGFAIPPGQGRTLLLRGVGPGLGSFGVANPLSAARLDVFDSTGRVVARSNSWESGSPSAPTSNLFTQVGAFPLAAGSRDAGLSLFFSPGNYTVQLSGLNGATGVGLIELYETDNLADRLLNLSSRVLVPAGANAIAGFPIRGVAAKRVVIRAAGPALTAFGLNGVLADPRLEIRDERGAIVASNDDWQNQLGAADLLAAFASVGAFGFQPSSKDAALIVTLAPGNYTGVMSGANDSGGIALIEVYELP